MVLPPIFTRRKRQSSAETPEVFIYDRIPQKLKVSVFMIMDEIVGQTYQYSDDVWGGVVTVLREEIGSYQLNGKKHFNTVDEISDYFINTAPLGRVLDAMELWSYFSSKAISEMRPWESPDLVSAISRINARLLEEGIGYQLIDGQIVEKSNEFAHQEIVIPALTILSAMRFSGANEEFRSAHSAYRSGEYKDCIADCLKAFESVMKTIITEKGWTVDPNATSSKLVACLSDNGYFPSYMDSQIASLRTMLTSSVPTTRNRVGGHGQGQTPVTVPKELAAFQLHQTASIIVFLAEL